jgi:hypothetical protein
MSLTEEQRAFWDEIGFEPLWDGASGDEIKESVAGIAYVFKFDGYDVPDDATIRAELVRRSSLGMSSDAFFLTTSSGRSVNLSDPRPEDIFAEDIARALSKICRFGAQATSFYSVAQHALEVAHRVPDALRLAALHHDSHEAFAGDLPTPLKRLISASSPVYDDLCKRLDAAIGSAFSIDPSRPDNT